MVLHYTYTTVKHSDKTVSEVPLVSVTLIGKETIIAEGVVDSGSDTVVIPKYIAELLGLSLSGVTESSRGIGGIVAAVSSSVTMALHQGTERYRFTVPCKVLLSSTEIPVLLGQEGFFDKFKISFDLPKKKFSLEQVDGP